MKFMKLLFLLVLLAGMSLACRESTDVGSEELLDIEEAEQQNRIGQVLNSPEPDDSPVSGAIGQPSPGNQPSPGQQTQIVEIALIHDDPYFNVDGNPSNEINVSAGSILKVVNQDDRTRQFADEGGAFASPALEPGQTWEYNASVRGEFRLSDEFVPFVFGILRVR